jgi:branched-chain amino acid transport system ATP-binding protein
MSMVRGVSLTLDSAETICIVGPNGAGKTTLLKSISGLIKPRAGIVTWLRKPVTGRSAHFLAKAGFVHVPEGAGGFPSMTVRENLEVALLAVGRRASAEDFARVFQVFPAIETRVKQVAGTLSGGEQRMLAIARGLMVRPLALLVDEPSLGLSPVLTVRVAEALSQMKASGMAIVIAEQNLGLAEHFGGRAILMNRGEFLWSGPAADLRSAHAVQHAVLGVGLEARSAEAG